MICQIQAIKNVDNGGFTLGDDLAEVISLNALNGEPQRGLNNKKRNERSNICPSSC